MSQSTPLWQYSAIKLSQAISNGQVSSLECVESVVQRMRATNGHVNAVVDDLGDDALRQAEEVGDLTQSEVLALGAQPVVRRLLASSSPKKRAQLTPPADHSGKLIGTLQASGRSTLQRPCKKRKAPSSLMPH